MFKLGFNSYIYLLVILVVFIVMIDIIGEMEVMFLNNVFEKYFNE